MAELAQQLQPYDESGVVPSDPRSSLKVLEGGGEHTNAKSGEPKLADDPGQSSEALLAAEEGADDSGNLSASPKSYYTKNNIKRRGFFRRPSNSGKKRMAITGSVILATIISSIILFISLLPLKIEHIVKNLQDHFYSTSQNAIGNESKSMLSRYIVTRVLPGYASCGTTIDKNCSARVFGTNPVSNMYKSWANSRLENRLAEKYGIEFQRKPDGWYVKGPGISTAGDNIGADGGKLESEFQRADRRALRQATNDAFQNETRWKQVFYRFKVGKLLEEKYGIRRCLILCAATDPLAKKVAEQKIAAKLYLVQRVLTPRNQTLGIALQCLFTNCAADQTNPTNAEPGTNGALNGAPENPETDTAIREGLTKLATQYGVTDIESLVSLYKDISDKGFQSYLVEKALTPIIGKTASGSLADKIPIVGWIDLTARLVNAGNDSSHNLKKLSYVTNASAAVALFTMYRSYADEIHNGHVSGAEIGSLVDSLGPGNTGAATDPEVGGAAGAEVTPLYHSLIDANSSANTSNATSFLENYFVKKTYAASTTTTDSSNQYKCNDGSLVPTGQLTCNEEILGQGNHYADLVHEFLNIPGINVITTIAQLWKDTVGQLFDLANSVFGSLVGAFDATCSIPGFNYISPYCQAKDLATKAGAAIMNGITQWLIPNPFSSNMSGGRTFDMMAAGADVAGNDSAHTTLGGQALSSQQTAAILTDQQQEDIGSFENLPLADRLFNTENKYSFVSKLASSLPLNYKNSIQTAVASFLSNPLGIVGHSIGPIISNQASAATITNDPFGVVQYGYPVGTIPQDPETYWDQHCSDNASHAYQNDQDYQTNNWNQAAANTLDPNSQMPVNNQSNPCLLIMATVGSAGGLFNPNLLTADDLSGSSTASTTSNPVSGPIESGSNAQLAQKILDYQKTGQYQCDNSGDCTDLLKIVNGQSLAGSDGCQAQTLDSRVLKLLLYTIENGFKIGTYALCGDHSFDSSGGHSGGFAVDISSVNGVALNQDTASAGTEGTKLDQFLNNLPSALKLNQQISYGYGEHYYKPMADLQQANGQLCLNTCVSFYTQAVEDVHTNHIHAGY